MSLMGSFRILRSCASFQTPLIVISGRGLWNDLLCRKYSVYPQYFIHPIFREEDQRKLHESDEAEKYTFIPVRPARTSDTASVFFDPLVDKIINHIMREGHKKLARTLLEKSFYTMKKIQLDKYYNTTDAEERAKIIINPWELLHKAVENSKPFLETVPVKRGGHVYQVPMPIRETKRQALAIKWLIEAGQTKDDKERFYKKFAYEIIEAANNTGQVIKRKQDLHKKCEANRAYAHYRWG